MIVTAILNPEDHRQPPEKNQVQPRHQRSTAQHHDIHAPLPLRASRPAQPSPDLHLLIPRSTNPAALCSSSYALHHIHLPRPDLAQPTRPQLSTAQHSSAQPSPAHTHTHAPRQSTHLPSQAHSADTGRSPRGRPRRYVRPQQASMANSVAMQGGGGTHVRCVRGRCAEPRGVRIRRRVSKREG
jgi:hypothetical protein